MGSEIRGYHVYVECWKPEIGQSLLTDRELSNDAVKFAVAVYDEMYQILV